MLLTLKKTHRKDAIDLFKLVQMCMGDRKSRHTGLQIALTIISKCWAITQLRDELYLQLCKQTTETPNMCVPRITVPIFLVSIPIASSIALSLGGLVVVTAVSLLPGATCSAGKASRRDGSCSPSPSRSFHHRTGSTRISKVSFLYSLSCTVIMRPAVH